MSGVTPFIGRRRALDLFHSLRSLREQKNVFYVEAGGGVGKTRLLRECLAQCNLQRRPWHVVPPDSQLDPFIDFYNIENRSVAGLRRSMIKRLGDSHFQSFIAVEDELRQAEATLGTDSETEHAKASAKVGVLRQRADQQFFLDFKSALRHLGAYAVLFFDTFEVVYDQRVGRWFLEEFLPNPATTGCVIVFAGRPPRLNSSDPGKRLPLDRLPANVQRYELEPFKDDEPAEYFRNLRVKELEAQEAAVLQHSEGNPLWIDLIVNSPLRQEGTPESWLNDDTNQVREKVIRSYLGSTGDVYEAIRHMGYLKRRYTASIFERLSNQFDDLDDFSTLVTELESLPFVKVRRQAGTDSPILTLHDTFQELIEEHGGGDWLDLADDLHRKIVLDWYPNTAIPQARDATEKNVLRAEHLGYVLDYEFGLKRGLREKDESPGLELYELYFKQAKAEANFELAELIWSEIARYLSEIAPYVRKKYPNDPKADDYLLAQDYYIWLYDQGQHGASAAVARFVAERYHEPVTRRLSALNRLGSSLRELGRITSVDELEPTSPVSGLPDWAGINTTEQAAALGLSEAFRSENIPYQVAFYHQLGLVKQAVGQWPEAKELFDKNHSLDISTIPTTGSSKTVEEPIERAQVAWAQSELSLAVLEARLGEYPVAKDRCKAALEVIFSSRFARVTDQASGYYHLGQIQRFDSSPETAQANYDKALDLLGDASVSFKAAFLQGRGANYYEQGVRRRQQQDAKSLTDDIERQTAAFTDLTNSLELCREFGLRVRKPDNLRRLAQVYLELHELQALASAGQIARGTKAALTKLRNLCGDLRLEEERHWRLMNRLASGEEFHNLTDPLKKAQRLLEVSFLEAEELNQYHECLHGITEAARVALRLGSGADVRRYVRYTASLRRYAYQEELFSAQMNLILAHLHFDEGKFEQAAAEYGKYFPALVAIGGFARKHLDAQFEELRSRFERAAPLTLEQRQQALVQIEKEWAQHKAMQDYRPLLIRLDALRRKLSSG